MKKLKVWVIALSWYSDVYAPVVWNDSKVLGIIQSYWFEVKLYHSTFHRKYCWCPSIESRIHALEDAYADTSIDCIIAYLWWRNSIRILKYLPYSLIRKYKKPIVWYSDITILLNAIYTKTWVYWIHWPLFVDHGTKRWNYHIQNLKKILNNKDWTLKYSVDTTYSENMWRLHSDTTDQKTAPSRISSWVWEWIAVWWNIVSFVALCWTPYFPDLTDTILYIEDDECETHWSIDRAIYTLSLQPWFSRIQWIIIWRFHSFTWIDTTTITRIINNNPYISELHIPIYYWASLWHTYPNNYFPIWKKIRMNSQKNLIMATTDG